MDRCISRGRMGVVSISPQASRIGVEILNDGGNAVDAYIATQLALEAYEPGWTGLGGGGFALLYFGGSIRVLDFRETAPYQVEKHVFTREELSMGYKAVATPGMGRGLEILHNEYGELGLDDVIKKVLKHLDRGVKVSKLFSHSLKIFKSSFKKVSKHPYSKKKFLYKGGPPPEGMKLRIDGYINLLKSISREGFEVLYNGYAADVLIQYVREGGGLIRERDLRRYMPIWRRPLRYKIGVDMHMYTVPPPGSGKLVAELYRRLSKTRELDEMLRLYKWIQDARMLLQDPKIGVNHFYRFFDEAGSTAHFSVIDREGNIVSATTTLECFMGSGVTVEGLDIILNDEMHDFNLDEGYNRLRGWVRPASSMAPLIVTKGKKPYLVLGASGGRRIFSALAQILYGHFILGLDIYKAILRKRIHYDPGRKLYLVEDDMDYERLEAMGFKTLNTLNEYPSPYNRDISIMMGVAEALQIGEEEVIGVSDPRKRCGAYLV